MMHSKRRWSVSEVESSKELAHRLTQRTWTCCTGFFVRAHPSYLFLNDATHEVGAAEYGVIKGGLGDALHTQIESITFSWASEPEALTMINEVLAGRYDDAVYARRVHVRLQTPREHGW